MSANDESEALRSARRQRHGVRAALVALESATASASTDAAWAAQLDARLGDLRDAWAHHVHATEGDGGLFAETIDRAPRLAKRTQVLRDEHVEIAKVIDDVGRVVTASRDGEPDTAEVRRVVTDLMGRVARHRQLGADLVFEAYHVDIEGGD